VFLALIFSARINRPNVLFNDDLHNGATMLKNTLIAAAFILPVALPSFALAEASVSLEVMTEQVEIEEGVEIKRLVPAQTALPGDEVVYVLTLDNPDKIAASDIDLTMPINSNILLTPQSFASNDTFDVTFSVDDGETFGKYSTLKVTEAGKERSATPEDITHARVEVDEIEPRGEIAITYRAEVK
jgi:hypothetical protein